MNLPNKLTLLRIILIPFFVIFAKMPNLAGQLVAVLIYVAACVTDMLDGRIARANNLVTNFGKFMDPIADKLLVMAALVVLTYQQRMPDWVCIIMLAREFLVSGLRLIAVENGRVIAAGPLGKLKTVFQMISTVGLMLFYPLDGTMNPMAWLSVVLMYVALALTVVSGADYIMRNKDCIRDM